MKSAIVRALGECVVMGILIFLVITGGIGLAEVERRCDALEAENAKLWERVFAVEADNARHILKTEGLSWYGGPFEPTIENGAPMM